MIDSPTSLENELLGAGTLKAGVQPLVLTGQENVLGAGSLKADVQPLAACANQRRRAPGGRAVIAIWLI